MRKAIRPYRKVLLPALIIIALVLTAGVLAQTGVPEKAIEVGGPVLVVGVGFAVVVLIAVIALFKYVLMPMYRERAEASVKQIEAAQQAREREVAAAHQARERDLDRLSTIMREEMRESIEAMKSVNRSLEGLKRAIEKGNK